MTNDFFFNHFLGFLKLIKLLVILFIIKLHARNNIFKLSQVIYLQYQLKMKFQSTVIFQWFYGIHNWRLLETCGLVLLLELKVNASVLWSQQTLISDVG